MDESLETARRQMIALEEEVHKMIIGMDEVLRLTLICLCSGRGSHILLEGVPGLAKTLMAMLLLEKTAILAKM